MGNSTIINGNSSELSETATVFGWKLIWTYIDNAIWVIYQFHYRFIKRFNKKKEEKPKCRKSICVMVLLSSSNPKQHLILFFLKITIARFIHSAFKWILINACFVERWMQKGILILYQKHDILVNMLFPLRTHTHTHRDISGGVKDSLKYSINQSNLHIILIFSPSIFHFWLREYTI